MTDDTKEQIYANLITYLDSVKSAIDAQTKQIRMLEFSIKKTLQESERINSSMSEFVTDLRKIIPKP